MTTVSEITYQQIFNRLIAQLPPWFGNPQFVALPTAGIKNPSTNFNNVTWAYLITAFNAYSQFQYDWLQTRIGAYELKNDPNYPGDLPYPLYPIANGDNLDLIAQDFFGNDLTRRPGESDDSFRNRILSNVLRLKATRPAMLSALLNLVTPAFQMAGIPVVPPAIYEYWEYSDNGVYNLDNPVTLAFGTPGGPYGIGAYGSGSNPYQCIIIVFLPSGNGLANYPGYSYTGESVAWGAGFGSPSITPSTPAVDIPPEWYGSQSLLDFYVTESDILTVINLTKVLGTVCHLFIEYVN